MDDEAIGWIIGIVLVLALLAVILYVIFLVAAVVGAIAGAAGTAWGGGTALKNYFCAFKENVIDSNRKSAHMTV